MDTGLRQRQASLSFALNAVGNNLNNVVTDFDDFGDDRIDLDAFAGSLIYKGRAAFNGVGQVNVSASGADVLCTSTSAAPWPSTWTSGWPTTLASMAVNDFIS
jgi:hypothetical protein